MKILALDYGQKRIGLAVAETSFRVVFPKGIIENRSDLFVVNELQKLIIGEKISKVVVGLPRYFASDETTEQERTTRTFYEMLKNELEIRVELFDERLTTRIATEKMKVFVKKRKGMHDDEIAAQILLEGYLEKNPEA